MINLKNIAALISYRLSYELTKKDNARSLCLRFRCRKMTKILTRALHATRTHQAHTDKIHWSSIDGRSGYFSCFSFLSFFFAKILRIRAERWLHAHTGENCSKYPIFEMSNIPKDHWNRRGISFSTRSIYNYQLFVRLLYL